MARMLDLIRSSQVPSNLMQFAAHGALSVPPEETVEILVYLALHNKIFGEQARMTLAGWDERASKVIAADPKTSAEVLGYFISPENLRASLLQALAQNPAVGEEALARLAVTGSRSVIEDLLKSRRVLESPRLLEALQANPNLRPNEVDEIGKKLSGAETSAAAEGAVEVDAGGGEGAERPAPEPVEPETHDGEVESLVAKYLQENAAEIEAEKDKAFQPLGLAHEEFVVLNENVSAADGETADAQSSGTVELEWESAPQAVATVPNGSGAASAAAKPAMPATGNPLAAAAIKAKKLVNPALERRDSTLMKISRLDIKGRIALAMRGSKEERTILIRDSTKLVALAVLDSPKISDGEVEKIALQKNVLESVLRMIPLKRRFAKNYNIMRNLVFNPRTPLDLSLSLMKNLLVHDLKNLAGNKEVPETIRKLALRMYKQKMEKKD